MKTIVGTRCPSGARRSAATTALIEASENALYAGVESMPPQVSKIITASRAGGDLRVEIGSDGLRIDIAEALQEVRPAVRHPAHGAEVGAAASFDHVARERERASGETQQRHATLEGPLDLGDRIEHVPQACHVGHAQPRDRCLVGGGAGESGPFSLGKAQPEAHRIGHGENIGEQNRRVERKARERLQRHLGGERRRLSRA